ncbi:MAG: lytic murein transglycosylase [Pseudomonadota bacterium]
MAERYAMRIFVLLLLCLFACSASAESFQSWLEDRAWPAARAEGVTRQTFERLTSGLTPDMTLPGLSATGAVPALDAQAEFAAPARYFGEGNLQSLAAQGRSLARKHGPLLARLETRYGVPGHIILAIWGRESAFGRAAIRHDALRVLATRGYAGTRRGVFTDEFGKALKIAAATGLELRSSWAGAMGQPQFLPSSYLTYAADGDGDGRADIWRSEADTLASIAKYLSAHGYDGRRDWGFEVSVPATVSCTANGPDQGRSIAAWERAGITRVSGRPFPAHERRAEAFLMMPAGRSGPAFLVTPNFYAIKEYNESDLYALFIGHLGDRIAFGTPAFRAPWRAVDKMRRGEIAAAQRVLEGRGFDVGGADGLIGFKTRRAIGLWQAARNAPVTCLPTAQTLRDIIQSG